MRTPIPARECCDSTIDVHHRGDCSERPEERFTLLNSRRETGSIALFGKEYHWARNSAGQLTLLRGPDPRTNFWDAILSGPHAGQYLVGGDRPPLRR